MRTYLTLFIAATITASSLFAADEFPYQATIAALNVTARSGPGYSFYPTERLPKGTQVEVYSAGENGWLAIRPTEEAFDWMPAASLRTTDDPEVAIIAQEAAPAWIGSNVRKIEKHVSQIKLKPGESVAVLEKSTNEAEDGGEADWYKIAPPAGEFRWVQAKFLSHKSPEEIKAEEVAAREQREEQWKAEREASPGLLAQPAGMRRVRSATERPVLERIEPEEAIEDSPIVGSAVAATEEIPMRPAPRIARRELRPLTSKQDVIDDLGESAASRAARLEELLSERLASAQKSDATGPAAKPTTVPLDPTEFKDLLNRLEVDLTVMVSRDVSQWNISSLRQRAEALVEEGPTPLERGRARIVLEKILDFEATLPPDHCEPAAAAIAADAKPAVAKPTATNAAIGPEYDAVGFLMPVIGAKSGVPEYQLTDRQGNTLQYITPAPGVNLKRYEKKQVGVYGRRGYVESLRKQHVTAERVVDLDRHLR